MDAKANELRIVFRVKKRHCTQCLFTEKKLVTNERRMEILAACRENDTFFNCHKATAEGKIACCRGFYDKNSRATRLMRHAIKHKMVEFVD